MLSSASTNQELEPGTLFGWMEAPETSEKLSLYPVNPCPLVRNCSGGKCLEKSDTCSLH